MVKIIFMGEEVELTDEEFDKIQDVYIKCESCGEYVEGVSPREGEFMCEDCIG